MKFQGKSVNIGAAMVLMTGLSSSSNSNIKYESDWTSILTKNIRLLKGCEQQLRSQPDERSRYWANFTNEQKTQYQFSVEVYNPEYVFSPRHQAGWDDIPFESGFMLGTTHSRSSSDESIAVVDGRVKIHILAVYQTTGGTPPRQLKAGIIKEVACRANALIQYQLLTELKVPNTYAVFDAPKLGARFTLNSDNSEFTVSTPHVEFKGCLGSYDMFVGTKKMIMKSTVLLNEDGVPVADDAFLEFIRQNSKQ